MIVYEIDACIIRGKQIKNTFVPTKYKHVRTDIISSLCNFTVYMSSLIKQGHFS